MSRNSLKYNLNEGRYNIKTIISIFVILDVNIFFFCPPLVFNFIIANEISLTIGLLLGIRGKGNAKEFYYKLRAIAEDPLYNGHEDVRGHKLKQQIFFSNLAYDAWFFRKEKIKRKRVKKKRS